ncbi:9965_t:CDS:2 [Diversispora eburnea]|uniref:9965_t:CDS:1 n=1 Tax=Diversispora eburnea TaxID=1213867 RepID=A0A9N8WLC0_9GLOM|nr:9965_t:CDS:2 [Diversispora eburnea]
MAEQAPQTVDQNILTTNATSTSTATFWNKQLSLAEQFESDFKNHPLPLARIKKVMKSDQDVKMISAEAPILFSKACEIFISEITMRAWTHAEENKRRTLQRSDVASAVSRSDQFDFLIDIVPREEVPKTVNRRPKEEPTSDQMFTDQNVLAYYPHQTGIPYPPDPASYYQQVTP